MKTCIAAAACLILIAAVESCSPVPKPLLRDLAKSDAFMAALRWHECANANEVRMTWFLNAKVNFNVAMVSSIDLRGGGWMTSREVYDWASQATKQGHLDPGNLAAANMLADKLPESVDSVDPVFAVLVSVPAGGHRLVRVYNRLHLPEQVSKLYALMGEYIETTDPDAKSSAK
jgi:hypothetical protein